MGDHSSIGSGSKEIIDVSERRLLVSFSGGETSALMAKLIMERWRDRYDKIHVVFANTGQENEATLQFVKDCDEAFGLGVIWIEAVTPPERGVGPRWTQVNFETADRSGRVFENMIAKHGIPNPGQPHCTRELKTGPIARWARDQGWLPMTYDLAIGIRIDEIDRMTPNARGRRLIYPLVTAFPHSKPKVNEFWAKQPFRLNLKGYEGNCKWCWKKSMRKHLTIMADNPSAYDFPERMEEKYPYTGAGKTGEPRRFFRQQMMVKDIRELAKKPFGRADDDARQYQISLFDMMDIDVDAELDMCGSESCEVDFAELDDLGDD